MGDVLSVVVGAETPPDPAQQQQAQQQAPAIPDKFKGKSAEEIAAAYVELEKKLGQQPPPQQQQQTPPKTEIPASVQQADMSKFEAEFSKDGKLSDASYAELQTKHNLSRADVDTYVAGRVALASQQAQQIFGVAGGEDSYRQMVSWASTNLNAQEQQAYNTAVNHADPNVARLAVEGLKSRFTAAYGSNPNLVGGKAGVGVVGFRSTQEMVKAMNDPRYNGPNRDPAYIAEVEARVAAS